jgi:hypothetical protein
MHIDCLQGIPKFKSFQFVNEKICLGKCIFSQCGQLYIFFVLRLFLLTFFNQVPKKYYQLTEVARRTHFT